MFNELGAADPSDGGQRPHLASGIPTLEIMYSSRTTTTIIGAIRSLTVVRPVRPSSASWHRSYHNVSVLPSFVSTASPEFQSKASAMDALVHDLDAKLADARAGGGPRAAERMKSRGKKLPRER